MQTELLNKIDRCFREYDQCPNEPKYIIDIRQNAYKEFKSLGFPTKKDEEWRFTDTHFLSEIPFNIARTPEKHNAVSREDIENFKLHDNFENVLVTVNGYYSPELSDIKPENSTVEIMSVQDACKKYPEDVREHFGRYSQLKDNPFRSLNTAIISGGLFIKFPDNYHHNSIFHILHIIDVRKGALLCNPRTLLIAGKNAYFKIIESVHNLGDYAGFTNAVTEVYGDENSNIDYYKLQNDSNSSYFVGATDVDLKENSNFHSATISLDGKFVRNNLSVTLNGENINANFHGFFFATKDNLIDNHTFVNHSKPNCVSDEVYKGIIDGKSTGVFRGKILVAPDAQKTNAYQSNKNILLSEEATINTMPQLEIYADDVKCSHGTTTGYLDEESLFYLKARGISESRAKALLLNAFAADVFDKIKISALCDAVKSLTAKRLNIDEDIYFCNI